MVAVESDFSDLGAPVPMLDPETAGRALGIDMRQAAAIRAVWDR